MSNKSAMPRGRAPARHRCVFFRLTADSDECAIWHGQRRSYRQRRWDPPPNRNVTLVRSKDQP